MRFVQKNCILLRNAIRRVRCLLRMRYYRLILKKVGNRCGIGKNVMIFGPENITFGDNVSLNENVILQSCPGAVIELGNQVVLSYGTMILTGHLDFTGGTNFEKHVSSSVVIEDGAVINSRSIIFPGVTIGKGAIISAGSIVTQNVKPYTMVFGVPARVIKDFGPKEL